MYGPNTLMSRGIVPPLIHRILDYPLAALLIVCPLVLGFDDAAAIARAPILGDQPQ